jgi:endonuclease YncB( thermonuclease family)
LVESGHARAYGTDAAWPPKEEDRHGEKIAKEKFKEDLKKLEQKAKRAGLGAWGKPGR